jgi:hypothetical protein
MNFQKVYAFPNPVRKDFEGNLTITGLLRETHISITDISGNLVIKQYLKAGRHPGTLEHIITAGSQRVSILSSVLLPTDHNHVL